MEVASMGPSSLLSDCSFYPSLRCLLFPVLFQYMLYKPCDLFKCYGVKTGSSACSCAALNLLIGEILTLCLFTSAGEVSSCWRTGARAVSCLLLNLYCYKFIYKCYQFCCNGYSLTFNVRSLKCECRSSTEIGGFVPVERKQTSTWLLCLFWLQQLYSSSNSET